MQPGDILDGKYSVVCLIGKGRSSEVFQAFALDGNHQPVAVKLLNERLDNPEYQEAFNRESLALRTLNHPNVVRYLDQGITREGYPYIVTELCGNPLKPLAGPNDGAAVGLTIALLSALQHAHAQRVIHRDLKPQHILYVQEGDDSVPKIIDFGIAKIFRYAESDLTLAGQHTPGYACIQQISGKEAQTSFDLYGLAACLYWYLTGSNPDRDVHLGQLLASNTPQVARASFRDFLVKLANAPDTQLTSGVALRELEQLSTGWVEAADTYITFSQTVFQRVAETFDLAGQESVDILQGIQDDLDPADDRYPGLSVQKDGKDPEAWLAYTYRLVGRAHIWRLQPSAGARSFIVTGVDRPDPADLQTQKSFAAEMPIVWIPIGPSGSVPPDASIIRPICQQLILNEVQHQRTRTESGRRDRLVDIWETVFRIRRDIHQDTRTHLQYRSWSEEDGIVTVHLTDADGKHPGWTSAEPLWMSRNGEGFTSVGILVGGQNGSLVLKPHQAARLQTIAQTGRIGPDRSRDDSAIRRQMKALQAVRRQETVNQNLPNIVSGVQAPAEIKDVSVNFWFHTDLDLPKQHAVRQALGTQDILLIQGPPGTGKTRAIAELVLQILAKHPQHRILLASQSHVAVDQAIEQILVQRPHVSLLRLASPSLEDKVAVKAKESLPRNQVHRWREKVQAKSRTYLEEIGIDPAAARDGDSVRDLITEVEHLETQYKTVHQESMVVRSKLSHHDSLVPEHEAAIREELALLDEEARSIREDQNAAEQLAKEFFQSRGINVDGPVGSWREHVPVVEAFDSMAPGKANLIGLWDKWRRQFGYGIAYEAALAKRTRILSGTCLGIASHPAVEGGEFDWVIVDEAGRATAPELLVPIIRGRRVILVGDHLQLPPVLDHDLEEQELAAQGLSRDILEVSLFQQLFEELPESHRVVLDLQYRMHPSIAKLVSDCFYNSALHNGDQDSQSASFIVWPTAPITWLSTSSDKDVAETPQDNSYRNDREVHVIKAVLERLKTSMPPGSPTLTVGIITGYDAQRGALQRSLDSEDPSWAPLQLEINTVDAFQGRERDVILYSAVRSNPGGNIGFLEDLRRLNVALSRARYRLVIVGDAKRLRFAHGPKGNNPFRRVLDWIASHPDHACIEEAARALA